MEVLIVQSVKERKNRIPDFSEVQLSDFCVRVHSVADAISAIKTSSPGLVIVDVDIENGSGFQVFEDTMDVTYEKIVLTSSSQHRVKSIRFGVAQHLRKPLKEGELQLALLSSVFRRQEHGIQRMFNEQFNGSNQVRLSRVFLATTAGIQLLTVSDIVFIEDIGQQRKIGMRNGSILDTVLSLRHLKRLLTGNSLIPQHNTVLLAPQQVFKLKTDGGHTTATMRGGRRFPVSYTTECRIRAYWERTKLGIR